MSGENVLLCACSRYAPCAPLRKESGFGRKAALLRKEYQDCRLVQACYDAVFLPSCTATAAFPAIPCRCGWVLWPVSVREVSVTRVCTVMCFRNGSKSRISLPLWGIRVFLLLVMYDRVCTATWMYAVSQKMPCLRLNLRIFFLTLDETLKYCHRYETSAIPSMPWISDCIVCRLR